MLTEVILPSTVKEIAASTFEGCISLRRVEMSGVVTIEKSAFSGCTLLSEIRLNEGIQYIRETAFKDCISLTDINIPSSVINIGSNAFSGSAIKTLTVPASVEKLDSWAFSKMEKLELLDLLEQHGLTDLSDLSEEQGNAFPTDPQVLDIVMFVIGDLDAEGKIKCRCQEGEGERRYDVEIENDAVLVSCQCCGASRRIPTDSSLAAHDFLHCDSLDLTVDGQ